MAERPATIRATVFIDGQNLHYACLCHFGHGYCHPHLLAQELLQGRELAGIRFYTGIHDPRIEPRAHAALSRRLEGMKRNSVWTFARPLKYAEQEIVAADVPPCAHGFRKVDMGRRAREKGIDLRLALDMMRLARQRQYDVALIVSQDTDLNQAVEELMLLREELDLWLVCETAYPFSPASGHPNFGLRSCPRWEFIDEGMFCRIRDDTDYTKPAEPWTLGFRASPHP